MVSYNFKPELGHFDLKQSMNVMPYININVSFTKCNNASKQPSSFNIYIYIQLLINLHIFFRAELSRHHKKPCTLVLSRVLGPNLAYILCVLVELDCSILILCS